MGTLSRALGVHVSSSGDMRPRGHRSRYRKALSVIACASFLFSCTNDAPPPRLAHANGCARPIEATLAHALDEAGPPIAVLVDFEQAPGQTSWAALGLASCTGTLCQGIVPRWRLLRLCADTTVRDIERWY
jgi:hypothetical protein